MREHSGDGGSGPAIAGSRSDVNIAGRSMGPVAAVKEKGGNGSSFALFFSVFPSIMLPMFMAMADQTIVATALPSIVAELGGIQLVPWVAVAYLIANTLASPVYGRLGDMVGRRRMMMAALSVFTLGSILCCLATRMDMLIAARGVQGLGGGGLMTLSQALIGQAVPLRERGRYQGYLAAVTISATTFGPLIGALLTQHFGWRAVFLVNLPLAALAVPLCLRLVDRPREARKARFDFPGLALFVTTILPALLCLQYIQRLDANALPVILVLAAVAAVSLVLLVRQEKRAGAPLFPVTLMREPAVWRADVVAACHGAAFVSLVTFTPLYLRVVEGLSVAETGYLLLTLTAGVGVGSLVTGRLVSRTGLTALFPSVGLTVGLVGIGVLVFRSTAAGWIELACIYGAVALSFGTVMATMQIIAQHAAGPARLGAAAGSVQFSRSLGASTGTSAVGLALFVTLSSGHPEVSGRFASMLAGGPDAIAGLAAPEAMLVRAAIADAFQSAFSVIALFIGIGAVVAWTIPLRRI